MRALMIEDDPQIVDSVGWAFRMRWPDMEFLSTDSGNQGVTMAREQRPDIIILDLGLPDISGFDALKGIRKFSDTPIIVLTARKEEFDIVKGLEAGADDYLVKPFRQMELLSRIKALLRRTSTHSPESALSAGNIRLSPATGILHIGEREISLTRTEEIIMSKLMQHQGDVVTYATLAEALWNDYYPDCVAALRVYIRQLRQKTEEDINNPKIILNKHGVGYILFTPGSRSATASG
ncbi:MAG: response regulator transcription factor [Dehalogenimonas sp.]|uniref:Response regulator transcription factor n=1 Tax=Candidatus Dehalogenimonas loeffleri TaxID=3127115 RepID=A0ABZ2J3D5_9CHLR|nr:response regulator transcription factor [Dehalogenimonas sp.]